MRKHILITGGAGFIGSHVADELLKNDYRVKVLDSLLPQVHGPAAERPAYLSRDVEFIKGDVRDPIAVSGSLKGIDAVIHLAAMVGVGQSMYEVNNYTSVNNGGTSVLLEAIIARPVERLIVASCMSIYGEGLYAGPDGNPCEAVERSLDQVCMGDWELKNASGETLIPVATPEAKSPCLASVYALSKYDQERM